MISLPIHIWKCKQQTTVVFKYSVIIQKSRIIQFHVTIQFQGFMMNLIICTTLIQFSDLA